MAKPQDVSLSWGRVAEVKKGQVKVRTRYRTSDFINVFVPGTSAQYKLFRLKKNDLVLVLSINGVSIAFAGGVSDTLELPNEGLETIVYGTELDYEESDISDQSKEDGKDDEEDDSSQDQDSDEVLQSIKVMNKKVVVEGFDEVVLKTKSIKVESENIRFGTEESLKTGVVTQACQCAFTGAFHPEASKIIKASK